jgi:hypothetical protein
VTSWYSYNWKQLSDLSRHCHNWFDLSKYGAMCIIHDNACSHSCHSKEGMIICCMCIRRIFHSPYHKDLWMFSFSFLFYYLCSGHCSSSLESFLIIAMLISYYIGMYSSSLPHIATNALLLLIELWQITPSSFWFSILFVYWWCLDCYVF